MVTNAHWRSMARSPYMPVRLAGGDHGCSFPAVVLDSHNGGDDELRGRFRSRAPRRKETTPMIIYTVPGDGTTLDQAEFDLFTFVDSFACRRNSDNRASRISVAETTDIRFALDEARKHARYDLPPSTSRSFNTYFSHRDAASAFRIQDTRFWDVENSNVEPSECDEVAYCHIEPYPIADMPAFVYLEPLLDGGNNKKKKKKKKRKLSQSEHQKVMRIMIGYTLGFFVVAIATFYVVYFF